MAAKRDSCVSLNGKLLLVFLAISGACASTAIPLESCFENEAEAIPQWHIFHRLCKPIVFGHRGNPKLYQENSLEGIKSVPTYGGQGVEMDVYLTKDNKLVLFHDSNALRLTGVNKTISEMTSSEINELRYKKKIKYGGSTYTFKRKSKVAYLDSVLRWAKNKELLLLLELKPSELVLDEAAVKISAETGAAVAKMVRRYRMHRQVLINSFDTFATLSAKRAFPKLVVGTFVFAEGWDLPTAGYAALKAQYQRLMPGLKTCISKLPNDKRFADFMYMSGTVEKSIGATSTMLDIRIMNDAKFGGAANEHTINMIKRNYGKDFAVGVGVYDYMDVHDQLHTVIEPKYKAILKQGISFVFTDDLEKVVRLIKSTIDRSCPQRRKYYRPHWHHNHIHHLRDDRSKDQDGKEAYDENEIKG